jgi:hypothetical protein
MVAITAAAVDTDRPAGVAGRLVGQRICVVSESTAAAARPAMVRLIAPMSD